MEISDSEQEEEKSVNTEAKMFVSDSEQEEDGQQQQQPMNVDDDELEAFYEKVSTTRPLSLFLWLPAFSRPKLVNFRGDRDSATLGLVSYYIWKCPLEAGINLDVASKFLINVRRLHSQWWNVMGGTTKMPFEFEQEVYDALPKEVPEKGDGGLLLVNMPDGSVNAFSSGVRPAILFIHALVEKGPMDLTALRARMVELVMSRTDPKTSFPVRNKVSKQMTDLINLVEK
ncbi:MAG: hypothetical protein K2Q45_05265 [Nitrosomonas sp.]|nr:hypothetical protein [Nitrosomonas sp.]